MSNTKILTIDPKATDIALGVYKAKKGQLTVQSMESDEYKKETTSRKGRDRVKELAALTEPERAMVEKANAQGKGVLWDKGNGQSYYFVAQKPDEKQAGKDADKEKKAEAEKEKGGFLDWCGRNWGWLVAGAAAIAAGIVFLVRKNRKKSSSTNLKSDKNANQVSGMNDGSTGNNGNSNTGNSGNTGNNGNSNTGNSGNTGNDSNNNTGNSGNTGNDSNSNTGNSGNTGNGSNSNTGNSSSTQKGTTSKGNGLLGASSSELTSNRTTGQGGDGPINNSGQVSAPRVGSGGLNKALALVSDSSSNSLDSSNSLGRSIRRSNGRG